MKEASASRVPTTAAALGAAVSAAEATATRASAAEDLEVEEWRRKIKALSMPVVVARRDASDHQSLIDTSAGGSSSVHDHLELDTDDGFPKAMGHRGHVRGKSATRFHELDSEGGVYEPGSQGDASAMSSNGTRAVLRRDQRNVATAVLRRCAGWRPSWLARRPYAMIVCLVSIPFACSAVVVLVSKLHFGSEQALPELGARQAVERSRTTAWTMPPLPPQPPVLPMPPPTPSLPQPSSDPLPPAGRNSDNNNPAPVSVNTAATANMIAICSVMQPTPGPCVGHSNPSKEKHHARS